MSKLNLGFYGAHVSSGKSVSFTPPANRVLRISQVSLTTKAASSVSLSVRVAGSKDSFVVCRLDATKQTSSLDLFFTDSVAFSVNKGSVDLVGYLSYWDEGDLVSASVPASTANAHSTAKSSSEVAESESESEPSSSEPESPRSKSKVPSIVEQLAKRKKSTSNGDAGPKAFSSSLGKKSSDNVKSVVGTSSASRMQVEEEDSDEESDYIPRDGESSESSEDEEDKRSDETSEHSSDDDDDDEEEEEEENAVEEKEDDSDSGDEAGDLTGHDEMSESAFKSLVSAYLEETGMDEEEYMAFIQQEQENDDSDDSGDSDDSDDEGEGVRKPPSDSESEPESVPEPKVFSGKKRLSKKERKEEKKKRENESKAKASKAPVVTSFKKGSQTPQPSKRKNGSAPRRMAHTPKPNSFKKRKH